MTRTHFQKLFFMTTLVLMLVSCATPAPKGPLTTDALMNGVYQSKWALIGKVKLTNGICRESFIPSSSTQIVVKMAEPIAIGDLNGDRVDDAAVILISQSRNDRDLLRPGRRRQCGRDRPIMSPRSPWGRTSR